MPAAMAQATRLAHVGADAPDWPPRMITASWRLKDKTQALEAGAAPAYVWLPAGKLAWPGIDLSDA